MSRIRVDLIVERLFSHPEAGNNEKSDKGKKKKINFHDLAMERAALRRSLSDLGISSTEALNDIRNSIDPNTHSLVSLDSRMRTIASIIIEDLKKIEAKVKDFSVLRQEDPKGIKESLKVQKAESEEVSWIEQESIRAELGTKYDNLNTLFEDRNGLNDFEMRRLRESHNNPYAKKASKKILEKVRQEKTKLEKAISDQEINDATTFRAAELVSYKKSLHREGHIAPVPSVRKYLSEIGIRMISGKPMFLHGPTGTGKTSLARYAAEHFTGQRAEMVYCTPQTRESHIWGKQGLRVKEGTSVPETVDILGPLSRAANEGRVVIFDEFTALTKEQMVFLKGVFASKPGDSINIMGNGVIEIKPGFQMIFTANLKSEKNPERQELPPDIAREFEQNNLEVKYTPPD